MLRQPALRCGALRSHLGRRPPRRRLAEIKDSRDRKAWSKTLLLPSTTFPLKHKDPVDAELKYRARTTDELYRAQSNVNSGPLSILHDGPPYANGHLHMGHALNKILKDIINRYNVIRGRRVHYVPGWDCHGLPIEQKALQAIGRSHVTLSPTAVRSHARQTATEAIAMQKEEFRALAVMADWDDGAGTYVTMNGDFEIRQLRLFQKMLEEGHITHRLRPTYYSPSSRTALAESELSYKEGYKSRSVYVGFPVEEGDMSVALHAAYGKALERIGPRPVSLAVWTTTAWTLPANAGVNVGSDIPYVLAESTKDGRLLVLAKERVDALQEVFGPLNVVASLTGSDLHGTRYTHTFHPANSPRTRPQVFISAHVTSQSGTGLVHSAPAHGHEDYLAFAAAGLLPDALRCPVDDDGRFTADVDDWAGVSSGQSLVGKAVLGDAVPAVIDLLKEQGVLLAEENLEHRYPHDWKSKEPVIVRATPQWFADVEAIKPRAMQALDKVQFYPPQSRNRLEAFVTSRSEWCISRQRSWGVPIPALYDKDGRPLLDPHVVAHVIDVLEQKGTEHWWTGPIDDFLPLHLRDREVTKGTDTLDVWFDSGSSWTLLEGGRADYYLEGSDQHRGWFQSSLLTKLAVDSDETTAPYDKIISHGFVMDEQGQKMSKSAGNGVSPVEIALGTKEKQGHGADTLRMWAASVDYTKDVSIGPSAINHASETLRKIRSSTRFLLANSGDAPTLESVVLSPIDKFVLHELSVLEMGALNDYEAFSFNKVLQSATSFTSSLLSSFYFDVVKDTLYCEGRDNSERRAISATLREVLRVIRSIIAPIAPHLAEELHDHDLSTENQSVFMTVWSPQSDRRDPQLAADMTELLVLRSMVNALVETAREQLGLKDADGATVAIAADGKGLRTLTRYHKLLPQLLGSSTIELSDHSASPATGKVVEMKELGQLTIDLRPTTKRKCGRCWRHRADEDGQLCPRCARVIGEK